jgi:hypothetical protein
MRAVELRFKFETRIILVPTLYVAGNLVSITARNQGANPKANGFTPADESRAMRRGLQARKMSPKNWSRIKQGFASLAMFLALTLSAQATPVSLQSRVLENIAGPESRERI